MNITQRKKVLIFTDSRGQHKPAGCTHDIFAERLAKDARLDVDMFLCPMKWTTTLDFLEQFPPERLAQYDHVILYTGIVEWSPRPAPSARADLYNNQNLANAENLGLNTRDYSRKIVNNKKAIFDRVFGEDALASYLSRPFETVYEGQPTLNMYGLDMARTRLIPILASIPNLIFITSNRFVPGWEGDFKRGRPENIRITEQYAELFATELGRAGIPVVDLREWSLDEVKTHTCDNLHLTERGSDYIYERIRDAMASTTRNFAEISKKKSVLLIGNGPSTKELVDFGLHNLPAELDTFGMGAAYRYFERVNWWPDYYAWCDMKVVHSHAKAFKRIVEDNSIPIKRMFLSLPVSNSTRLECVPHSSTGDFCFRRSIELGYNRIFFIGVEGNYVEEIAESRPLTENEYDELGFDSAFQHFAKGKNNISEARDLFKKYLRIVTKTPVSNRNYFFDDYQQKGDVYSLPRTQTHLNAWGKTADMARNYGIVTFNLSSKSKITNFPKINTTAAIQLIEDEAGGMMPVVPYGFPIEAPSPLSFDEREKVRTSVGLRANEKLATLIIGLKVSDGDSTRHRNLRFLLDWIDLYYTDLFDVLIVEQGTESRLEEVACEFRPYVAHKFIHNPGPYNRGWGYNAAALHFTQASVIALLDTDVLLGANFLDEVVSCHQKFKVVSPYSTVYFTDESEAETICNTFSFNHLQRADGVKKPTTLTGGIVIIRRDTFLQLKGFEQYTEYAGEDRALDVTVLNHISTSEIRMAPYTYVHLYHPTGLEDRPRAKELFAHLRDNYGCQVDPNVKPGQDIHLNCKHTNRKATLQLMIERARSFGELDLYRSERPLTINGQIERIADKKNETNGVIFPPTIRDNGVRDLSGYVEKEVTGDLRKLDIECMSQFYNLFKGDRCFIIGNGPSLNKHDLSLLDGEYTFGVNSFYYKTRETGYRPFFYVVEDTSVMNENLDEIRSYYAPFRFFPTSYRDLLPNDPNTFYFRMNRGFYEKSSPNYAVPRFSTDATNVLYCGQSVTYINLQLAYFMGFTEVFLIGMDFDYVIPVSHKRTGDVLLSDTDDPNHFHKDYFGAGKTWKDPKLDRVLMNYRMADLAYSAVGRKIYNATIGGKLEIFDRVDYDALLRDPESGGKRTVPVAPPVTALGSMLRQQGNEDPYAEIFGSGMLEGRNVRDIGAVGSSHPKNVMAPTAPNPTSALSRLAGELLLDPASGLARLEDKAVAREVALALGALAQDDPLAVHFRRVEAFARSRVE